MTTDALRERGDSLEDAFFRDMDRKLIDELRAKKEREQQLDELAGASGIVHRDVLGALLDAGVHGEALVAVGLVPLIEVAWADHAMDAKEREAIMRAARDAGVTRGSTAAALLSAWLDRRPGAELLEAWKGYAAALVSELGEEDAASRKPPAASWGWSAECPEKSGRCSTNSPRPWAADGFRISSAGAEDAGALSGRIRWPDSAGIGWDRLPARLDHAREFAAQREISQGDPRETELSVIAAGPTADGAAVADADRAGVAGELVQQALGLEALVGRQALVLGQRPQLVAALLVSLDDLLAAVVLGD